MSALMSLPACSLEVVRLYSRLIGGDAGTSPSSIGAACNATYTASGANAYVDRCPNFLELCVEEAIGGRRRLGSKKLRRRPKERNDARDCATHAYAFAGSMATLASREKFDGDVPVVPVGTVRCFAEHVAGILALIAESDEWTKTGVLRPHDQMMLDACGYLACSASFRTFLVSDVYSVLAKLCKGRKSPAMLCPDVAEAILELLYNHIMAAIKTRGDRAVGDVTHEFFSSLSATGMLAQLLRALTVPFDDEKTRDRNHCIIELIENEARTVRKKLRPGTSAGDVLRDVIDGKDGWRGVGAADTRTLSLLRKLQRISSMANYGSGSGAGDERMLCHTCHKVASNGEAMLKCGKCHYTTYCSKKCQKDDWPSHKEHCDPRYAGLFERNRESNSATFNAFLDQNYLAIMDEIATFTRENNVQKKDLVLEIDFATACQGTTAMKGNFKVDTIVRYTEGGQPAKPDWGGSSLDLCLVHLKTQPYRLTPELASSIMCLIRHSDYSLSLGVVPPTSHWSDAALECFPLFEEEGSAQRLMEITGMDEGTLTFRSLDFVGLQLCKKSGSDPEDHYDWMDKMRKLALEKVGA